MVCLVILCPAVIMVTALTMVYRAVRQSEKKMSRYGVGSLRKNLQNNTQATTTVSASIEARVSGSRLLLSKSLGSRRSSVMRESISTKTKKGKGRSHSRQVLFRAFAYSCAWFLTWIFYIPSATIAFVFNATNPRTLLYMLVIFQPLQGVYNLAIYMHPKILSAKRKSKIDNNITWWRAFVTAFWSKGSDKTRRGRRNST